MGAVKLRSTWKRRFYPKLWRCTTLWKYHPKTTEFYRSEIERKQQQLEHINSYYWIIHPFSKFRGFYEIWMAVILALHFVYTPLFLSFHLIMAHEEGYTKKGSRILNWSTWATVLHVIMKLITWIDVILNFVTGYVKHGRVILKPRKIALHYLFSLYFVSDVITSLPSITHWKPNINDIILESLQLFRLLRLPTCIAYINRTGELFHIRTKWFDVGLFFVLLMLGLHWYTCVIFFIPQLRLYTNGVLHEQSWLVISHSLFRDFQSQYVHSLYMATTAVFCIQLTGPLTGLEKTEKLHMPPWEEQVTMIIYYVTGKIFTSLLIVIILNIFLTFRSLESKYERVMTQVSMFMSQQHLPIEMQEKVCTFYNYKYNRNFFKDTAVDEILSDTLRNEIRYHECSSMITNVSLFSKLPSFILGKILKELVPEIFLADDIVLRHGGVGDCMYFLSSGTVAVYTPGGKESWSGSLVNIKWRCRRGPQSECFLVFLNSFTILLLWRSAKKVCHLQDGAHFGEVALVLKGKKRTATIKAVEICELYRLDKKAFRACFARNSGIFEQLQETARQRTENTDKINVELEIDDQNIELDEKDSPASNYH